MNLTTPNSLGKEFVLILKSNILVLAFTTFLQVFGTLCDISSLPADDARYTFIHIPVVVAAD